MLHLLKDLKEDEILAIYLESLTDNLSDLLDDNFKNMKSEFDYDHQHKILTLTFHYGRLGQYDEIIEIFDKAFAMVERCSMSFGLKTFYTDKGIEQGSRYWYNFVNDIEACIDLIW